MIRVLGCIIVAATLTACGNASLEAVDSACAAHTMLMSDYSRCLDINQGKVVGSRARQMNELMIAASGYLGAEVTAKRMTEQEARLRLSMFKQRMKQEQAVRDEAALASSMASFGAMSNTGAALMQAGQPRPIVPPNRLQTTCYQSGAFLNCN